MAEKTYLEANKTPNNVPLNKFRGFKVTKKVRLMF